MTNMKNKSIILLLTLGLAFTACSRDEENLFDKSAAIRSQEAVDNAYKLLIEASNGWEGFYFANNESRGYNLILKFKEDGSVVASAKNGLTTGNKLLTDSNSLWLVTYDYGPILSFNTYNSVLHAWADPREDGDGYLGDYEFLILKATPDLFLLKGKKHSAYTILRPMPKVTPDEYFTQCSTTLSKYFGGGNIVTLNQGGKSYYLHNGSTGIFSLTEIGEKAPDTDPDIYPLCPSLDGFVMSIGFNDDRDERIYKLKDNQFVGENGSTIGASKLNQLFMTYIDVNKGWSANLDKATGAFSNAITAFQNKLEDMTGDDEAELTMVAITYSDTAYRYQGTYLARFQYEYEGTQAITCSADFAIKLGLSGDNVVVTYSEPLNATANTWYTKVPEFANLVNIVMGTFSLKAEEPMNPARALNATSDKCTIVYNGASNLQ